MIIIKIHSGMGNQMFQYALGRKLSIIKNSALFVDIADLVNGVCSCGATYMLHYFNIATPIATIHDINKLKNQHDYQYIREADCEKLQYTFKPEILNASFNSYLWGNWFSEKYFIDIKNILQNDFQFKFTLSDENKKNLMVIENCESIGIHIRKRDANDTPSLACNRPYSYYYDAINYLKQKLAHKNIHFFIFSNYADDCKDDFHIDAPHTFINLNNSNPEWIRAHERKTQKKEQHDIFDFILLRACKHQIISSSTFPWWAAWLNPNPEKIVIAPKGWLGIVGRGRENTGNIIPNSWVQL